MKQQQTIEQALRAQGWVMDFAGNIREGEQCYAGAHRGVYLGPLDPKSNVRVLRAPRPKPKYKPGTVALVRDVEDGEKFNALWNDFGDWAAPDLTVRSNDRVEVLRIIADPDGNPPEEDVAGTTDMAPTLSSIRETGRIAVDEGGDMWSWDWQDKVFRKNGRLMGATAILKATAPGYFAHWATKEEEEQQQA